MLITQLLWPSYAHREFHLQAGKALEDSSRFYLSLSRCVVVFCNCACCVDECRTDKTCARTRSTILFYAVALSTSSQKCRCVYDLQL